MPMYIQPPAENEVIRNIGRTSCLANVVLACHVFIDERQFIALICRLSDMVTVSLRGPFS